MITINFVALGCPKNLIDSEKMLGLLAEDGIGIVAGDGPADAAVINTCGFIADARAEAFEHIEAALAAKAAGQVRCVLVAGCLAQYWRERLTRQYPALDAVIGLDQRDQLPEIVRQCLGRRRRGQRPLVLVAPYRRGVGHDQVRLRLTEPFRAYLRISEGCSQGCAFCSIPRIRGPFRSKPRAAVIAEAEELIADGAVELTLIGQETTSYGRDLDYPEGLAGLLGELNQLPGLRWLRVLYAHPATVDDRLVDALAACDKVTPYLDLPLQHINDRLLKLMNRHIDRAGCECVIAQLRARLPDIALRTTMMVGFPGETEAEFEELLRFVQEMRFDALGAFAYSLEEGTAAARLPESCDEAVKQQRYDRLMSVQQPVAFAQAQAWVGRRRECLLEGLMSAADIRDHHLDPKTPWFRGRHAGQAPEIDAITFISVAEELNAAPGDFVKAEFTDRRGYDLVARALDRA